MGKDGVDIHDGDEGEVLLRKIYLQMVEYEEELKQLNSSSDRTDIEGGRSAGASEQGGEHPSLVGGDSGGHAVYDVSSSDSMEPYQILEEKHRLAAGGIGGPVPHIDEDQQRAGTSKNSSDGEKKVVVGSSLNEATSGDETKSSSLEAGTSPPSLSRHGAVRIGADGDETMLSPSNNGLVRMDTTEDYDGTAPVSSDVMISVSDSNHAPSSLARRDSDAGQDRLVEAEIVDENLSSRDSIVIAAKPDPWYRRNQWWLAGGAILLAAGTIAAILLSTDSSPADAPTMTPTTEFMGLEQETENMILSAFPAAESALQSESSAQSDALRWITARRFDDESNYTETRVLQQYALAVLFLGTFGESSWVRSDGWLNSTNECTWYGVECSSDEGSSEVVIGVNLPANGLNGTLPPDLAVLASSVLSLDLSGNHLVGIIPSSFGALTSVTTISLGSNQLSGDIPSSLQTLSVLKYLDVSTNKLSGTIPSEIGMLAALREMDVSYNDLIGALPSEIGQLSLVELFQCESNNFVGTLPSEIGDLSRLEVFNARSNALVGFLPAELSFMTNLEGLDLAENLFVGQLPSQITKMQNLTMLDVSDNNLSGNLPSTIQLMARLTSLNVGTNGFGGTVPPGIGFLESMVHLDLSNNHFSLSIPIEIFDLTNLVIIDLSHSGAQFDGTNVQTELSAMTNLEILRLDGMPCSSCGIDGLDGISPSILQLTNLRELGLSRTTHVGQIQPDVGLLKRLEVLDLSFTTFTGTLPSEIGLLTNLSILSLSDTEISGSIPDEYFGLTNLKAIYLGNVSPFRSRSIEGSISSAVGQLVKLKQLKLGNTLISGSIPTEIGLTQLEDLDLHLTAVTGTIPSEILELTNLKSLDLRNTSVSGSVPVFGSQFDKLMRIDLSSSLVSGSIPPQLWALSGLEYLDLGYTALSGSLSSDIAALSMLQTMRLQTTRFEGSTIPFEIGFLTSLKTLDLTGANMFGTIPPSLFLCSNLEALLLGGNAFSGSIPTEIGLTTLLSNFQLSHTLTTGSLPTEIGEMLLLESLDVSFNSIQGLIPDEIGETLRFLTSLNLESTRIAGPIPSGLAEAANLVHLDLSSTGLTGSTIPSAIGALSKLVSLDLSFASLIGTVPSEMESLSFLTLFDIRGNDISGSISDPFACSSVDTPDLAYILREFILIDCDELECLCCECAPTIAPSVSNFPSVASLTDKPSSSPFPTVAPTSPFPTVAPTTLGPTTTMTPTVDQACYPFSSLSLFGTDIDFIGSDPNLFDATYGVQSVDLPFPFKWRGEVEFSSISVSVDGFLYFNNTDLTSYNPFDFAFPIGYPVPRIAVAQEDLTMRSSTARVLAATVGDAFIISWEEVEHYSVPVVDDFFVFNDDFYNETDNNPADADFALFFQVALYSDGTIEMRWGDGNIPVEDSFGNPLGGTISAGLEDLAAGMVVPVTGSSFNKDGLATIMWPKDQCRQFVPANASYIEFKLDL